VLALALDSVSTRLRASRCSVRYNAAYSRLKEFGCVIAYSSLPGKPFASALFGRPEQGVVLQSVQVTKNGRRVLCVNPADLSGGAADFDSFFAFEGAVPTPWVEFPGLCRARCESSRGATWLQVQKTTGPSYKRPVVTERGDTNRGYHAL
jgi:hypothetical protein